MSLYTIKLFPHGQQVVYYLKVKGSILSLSYPTVVTSKDLKKSGDIWVCPNGDNVCTRFFFVYDDSCGYSDNLDTRKGDFRKEIDHATEHIRAFRKKK